MKSIISIKVILVAIIGLVVAVPATKAQAQVTLSLAEFEELFSSARLKAGERRLEDQRARQLKEHEHKLSQLERKHKALFPENFQVLQHTAEGSFDALKDVAVFDMKVILRVMDPQWTMVPLLSNSTVASDWSIHTWTEQDGFLPIDYTASPDVLLLRKEQPTLATNRSGLFQINFKAYSRVVKTRNIHQLTMAQFLYPISDFSLRVAGAVREFSVQPVAAVLDVQPRENSTNVHAILPLTAERVEIRWLDATETVPAAETSETKSSQSTTTKKPTEEEETAQVTVIHEVMHSVGEGMVRSSHILEFSSTSSELSSPVYFVVHGPNTRISSVEGHAVQRWEVVDTKKNAKVVRVVWKTSHLDSTATVLVQTESDRFAEQETDKVELPRIECRDVLRQEGHVGVVKDANVEVHEHSTRGGLIRCEPTDISSQLRLNMDRPIVLSYKYRNAQNASVVLDVQEHVAMETLEATVDRAHYKAVVTDTHIVHSLLLVLQSTKLQYLELSGLPETASMFTLLVNSVPAKPVQGQDKAILVPLLVGLDAEAANEGRSLLTSVEVTYISSHSEPLGQNGTIPLTPPHLRLPISVLTMHLRLPLQYKYTFSRAFEKPAQDLAFPVPSSYSYQTGKRVIETDYEFSFKDDVWPDEKTKPQESAVKIVTPNTGRSFYFHRLLVVDTELSLNATYSRPEAAKETITLWSRILGGSKS